MCALSGLKRCLHNGLSHGLNHSAPLVAAAFLGLVIATTGQGLAETAALNTDGPASHPTLARGQKPERLPADPTTLPDRPAVDLAMDAVLVLRSPDAEDLFLGSAFLWGKDGRVAVTNAHVVGDAEEVRLTDRQGNVVTGEVIARDRLRDVAVISVPAGLSGPDGSALQGLIPSDQAALPGLEVYALGAPLGAEFTMTRGMVSAMARQIDLAVPLMFLQHDAAVNPGSSGGPLIDAAGGLMGMNSRIADGSRMFVGIAYAIATEDLTRIVEGLIAEDLSAFPKLGLTARPVDRKLAALLEVPVEGLLVDGVSQDGLAGAAGILAGDIILAVGEERLSEPGAFAFALEAALSAGEAQITLLRAGESHILTLAFTMPEPEPGLIGLRLRGPEDKGATGAAEPERIRSYRLGALGVVQGEGGVVTALTANSPAALAGLARGDQILAVNGTAVDDAALSSLEITGPTLFLIRGPDGLTRHLYLDPWGASTGPRPIGGANVLDPAVVVF